MLCLELFVNKGVSGLAIKYLEEAKWWFIHHLDSSYYWLLALYFKKTSTRFSPCFTFDVFVEDTDRV